MAKSRPLFFTRIKLTNWRNFREAEVPLQKRAIFVGANASGKSNLLDAFRFLRDLASVGGGLQASVRARGNMLGVRSLFARRPPFVEIEVDIGDEAHPKRWTYRLRFNKDGSRDRPIVEEEEVGAFDKPGSVLNRKLSGSDDREQFIQTDLEQISSNREFREIAEFFRDIRYLHIVPQIVRDSRRHVLDDEDPFGGDLLQRMKRTPPRIRDARLRHIGAALKIATPSFEELALVEEDGKPHLEAKLRHWRPNPTKQREDAFSDGTLRLIGFLWSVQEGKGPLLLEEPELSLNEEIVRQLGALIARVQRKHGRQVLVTTHSRAFLSDEGIGLDEAHILTITLEGTVIRRAADDAETRVTVEAGIGLGEVALAQANPKPGSQLALDFDAD